MWKYNRFVWNYERFIWNNNRFIWSYDRFTWNYEHFIWNYNRFTWNYECFIWNYNRFIWSYDQFIWNYERIFIDFVGIWEVFEVLFFFSEGFQSGQAVKFLVKMNFIDVLSSPINRDVTLDKKVLPIFIGTGAESRLQIIELTFLSVRKVTKEIFFNLLFS